MEKREYKVDECVGCKQSRYIAAKGLCRRCYARVQRNGTLEKVRKRTLCRVYECDRNVVSNGFCALHWHRVQTTSDPNKTLRPEDWGVRGKHPMHAAWVYAKYHGGVSKRWESFWNFVADVVSKPSPTARLHSKDGGAIGPDNYEWREKLLSFNDAAQYAREHRKVNPDYWKDSDLKKKFGITLQTYQEMLVSQNGVCAICCGINTVVDRRTGKPRMLAVDHCHTTGKVRKLLCQHCNQAIGLFKDDPKLLLAAASYLGL